MYWMNSLRSTVSKRQFIKYLAKLTEASDFDILAMAKGKAAVPVTVSIIMIINEGEKIKWDYLIFSRRIKKRKK